jgi:tetratricopeptide (TPR) repeat protein
MKYIAKFNRRLSGVKDIRDFDRVVEMYPHLPLPYNERGNKRLSLNDYRGALEDFSKAVDLDPT